MSEYIEGYREAGRIDQIIDVIDPDSGLTACMGQTFEQVRERYPNAERVNLDEHAKAHAQAQDTPITWEPTTRAKYHEMLEVLPPAMWIGGAFLVGEPMDHHATSGQPRYQGYMHHGLTDDTDIGYFVASRPMTRAELRAEVNNGR